MIDDDLEILRSTSLANINRRSIDIQADTLLFSSTEAIRSERDGDEDDNDTPTTMLKALNASIILANLQTNTNELRRFVDNQKFKNRHFENKLNYIEDTVDATRRLQVVYNQEFVGQHINLNLRVLEEMIANYKDCIGYLVRIIQTIQVRIDELERRQEAMKHETKLILEIQDLIINMEKKLVTSNEAIISILMDDTKKGEELLESLPWLPDL